jgi:sugar/nucleoside kinase (ribokinase family)
MSNVLGIGNALVDVMTRLENDDILKEFGLPKGSMQLVSKEFSNRLMAGTLGLEKLQSSGGSAANTIHGLAHLGVQTGFVGKTGKDNFGRFFEKDMKQNGIHPVLFHGLEETGRSVALVSPDSERTFATFLGAAVDLHEEDITSDLYEGYDILHVEGYLVQNKELIKKTLRLAKSHGLTVTFDMASYNVVAENIEFLKTMITKYVDVVFANEQEAEAFTGKSSDEALKVLSDFCDVAVIKMGVHGSMVRKGNIESKIGIVEVNSIDTTGAGDLYASGFIYGMCNGLSIDQCGQLGAVCGGYITEVIGAKMDQDRWISLKEKIKEIENTK